MYKNARIILLHLYIYKSRNLLLVYMLFGALFFVLDLFQVVHSVLIKVGHRELNDQV